MHLPTFSDVEDAARQIAGFAHRTPVATSRTVNARTGAAVFFKCENLQRGGAFKFRGAYNALSRLSTDERRRGVVTFSSGNHAQAIALAGQLLDIPRVIVMPSDAPAVKRIATAGYGGEVVLYNRDTEDREAIGHRLAHERGLTLIPPYDHADIIAGQGTATRELIEDAGPLDYLFVPCGGGGLPLRVRDRRQRDDARLQRDRRRARSRRRCDALVSDETAADGSQPGDGRGRRADAVARLAHLPARAATRHRHGDGRRCHAPADDVLSVGTYEAGRRANRGARRRGGPRRLEADSRRAGRHHPQRRQRRPDIGT